MDDDKLDLGHVKEGVVELDPMTGHWVLRCPTGDGGYEYFDVQAALEGYRNEDVRLVLVSVATIRRVEQMVNSGDATLETAPKAGG